MARPPKSGGKTVGIDKSLKLEKIEHKEHKDAKIEKAEKLEAKEHKDAKVEKLEKVEAKEHKDAKIEKVEHKEFTKFEHGEKHVFDKGGKELVEVPDLPGDPANPVAHGIGTAGHGDAQHFIDPANRPDLGRGALSGEEDQG